jgi:peroxiredoxin Q/BCP
MKRNIQLSTFNLEHPIAAVWLLVGTWLTVALALLAGVGGVSGQVTAKPAVGDQAPLVSGQTQEGKNWKLADAVGKKVVLLYFYPKDDTPGCTKEACGLRDRMGSLQKANVEVVGVSFDSAESHQKFITKHKLNFTLLTDTDGKIADTYGVRAAGKNMARRVSFLIGTDGKILHVTDSPSADTHLAEMSEAVAKLKKE